MLDIIPLRDRYKHESSQNDTNFSLKDLHVRFKIMADNAPLMIWISDRSKQRTYFNKRWLAFTGRKLEEEVGFGWTDQIHPKDLERILTIYNTAYLTHQEFDWEYRLKRSDKEYRWIMGHGVPQFDGDGQFEGFVGYCIDITEQKLAIETANKLASIVEFSDDAIISINLDQTISSWNKGAEKIYGYSKQEALGKPMSLIVPANKKEEFNQLMEVIQMGASVDHVETTRKKKNGTVLDVSLTMSPIKNEIGQIIGASGIARDISEYKELERRKDAFISMASHELKTPLTSTKAFIQVLLKLHKNDTSNFTSDLLQKTENQLNKISNTVTYLLDLSRIRSGKFELKKTPFNLDETIKSSVSDVQITCLKHNIYLEGEDLGKIYGDEDRISQVVINLLNNAVKYSPNSDKIKVHKYKQENKVVFSVTDYGIGIASTHQEKIFDRFYRASGTNEKTYPGLGIGLFICHEIVKRHGGKIWVESKKGQGSTFSVCLPLK